jgi:hypothetical protein
MYRLPLIPLTWLNLHIKDSYEVVRIYLSSLHVDIARVPKLQCYDHYISSITIFSHREHLIPLKANNSNESSHTAHSNRDIINMIIFHLVPAPIGRFPCTK